MTTGKNKGKKEESVKLDMSFEDAMRLAVKTSPAFMQKLTLGKAVEILDCENRTIELVYINAPDAEELLNGFQILAEVKEINPATGVFIPANEKTVIFISSLNPKQIDKKSAFFNINSLAYIPVLKNERVYLTLLAPPNKETKVTSCYLNYVKHLSSRV